ncbi:MAG: hypothetical protein JJU36_02260 [Phycisphaeraceae bacterium]|nr:hypothetical protein [Phycisphaeraceae bacterium]
MTRPPHATARPLSTGRTSATAEVALGELLALVQAQGRAIDRLCELAEWQDSQPVETDNPPLAAWISQRDELIRILGALEARLAELWPGWEAIHRTGEPGEVERLDQQLRLRNTALDRLNKLDDQVRAGLETRKQALRGELSRVQTGGKVISAYQRTPTRALNAACFTDQEI